MSVKRTPGSATTISRWMVCADPTAHRPDPHPPPGGGGVRRPLGTTPRVYMSSPSDSPGVRYFGGGCPSVLPVVDDPLNEWRQGFCWAGKRGERPPPTLSSSI